MTRCAYCGRAVTAGIPVPDGGQSCTRRRCSQARADAYQAYGAAKDRYRGLRRAMERRRGETA